MLHVTLAQAIESPWTDVEPLRLGDVPTGLGTPDVFVKIEDDQSPVLRVDIYAAVKSSPFRSAFIWCERVFVGYEHQLIVIDPWRRSGVSIDLGSYFGSFHSGDDYILVASAQHLFRVRRDGTVIWKSPTLGIDGVMVRTVYGDWVEGEGEWDPPGGWKPFTLRLDSGQLR